MLSWCSVAAADPPSPERACPPPSGVARPDANGVADWALAGVTLVRTLSDQLATAWCVAAGSMYPALSHLDETRQRWQRHCA